MRLIWFTRVDRLLPRVLIVSIIPSNGPAATLPIGTISSSLFCFSSLILAYGSVVHLESQNNFFLPTFS